MSIWSAKRKIFLGVFQMKVGTEEKGGQDDKPAQKSAVIFP